MRIIAILYCHPCKNSLSRSSDTQGKALPAYGASTMTPRLEIYPILPLPYGSVLFPGKTSNISPADREDVTAVIAKYYSGALRTKTKDSAPLIVCAPLRSPYLSPDGKNLIENSGSEGHVKKEIDVTKAKKEDIYEYGCIARISGIRGGRRGEVALVVEGQTRCKLHKITQVTPFFEAKVEEFSDQGQCTHTLQSCAEAHHTHSRRLGPSNQRVLLSAERALSRAFSTHPCL